MLDQTRHRRCNEQTFRTFTYMSLIASENKVPTCRTEIPTNPFIYKQPWVLRREVAALMLAEVVRHCNVYVQAAGARAVPAHRQAIRLAECRLNFAPVEGAACANGRGRHPVAARRRPQHRSSVASPLCDTQIL